MMIRAFIVSFIAFSVISCNGDSELIKNSWIVTAGTFHGRAIEFKSTDLITVGDRNGNRVSWLFFLKNNKAFLPGINCNNISATWEVIDGKIKFSVDSSRYEINKLIDHAGNLRMALNDSIQMEEGSKVLMDTLSIARFKNAMEIYGELFEYEISYGELLLKSKNVRIHAIRDRTTDDLFKGI